MTKWVATSLLLTALAAGPAAAVGPEGKCEAGKNQESGKYAFCLAKAEAKLLKTKGACTVTAATACYRDADCPLGEACAKDTTYYSEAVTKCQDKYAAKWTSLEQKAADVSATCPDGLLQGDVKTVIDECIANVASGLAGEGLTDCTGDLATCSNDLTMSNNSLNTCNGNYTACTGALATCNTTLTTCQGDLNDCQNPTCGDNSADLGEQCDGSDLDGATCTSLGFTGGTLACSGGCTLVTTGCTPPPDACGDGNIDGGEDCDGTNLNGGTCVGEGFTGGTLSCGAGCTYDPSSCYTTRFVDNGDGTVSDYETGLTWEKKSDDGSIHDKDNTYTWSTGAPWSFNGTAATTLLATLNGGGGFAGHTDWRLPTPEELQSIVDYADTVSPMVPTAFDTSCAALCTVTSCSCAAGTNTWSSSTYAIVNSGAWFVFFGNGSMSTTTKSNLAAARAVRTGL